MQKKGCTLKSARAAKQWRYGERSKILGDRDGRCHLLQGLEEIDLMLAAEAMKNKPKKRGPKLPDTPPSTPKERTVIVNGIPKRSPLQQRIRGDRLCKGQHCCSEREPSDVVEEVRKLTTMSQSKYSRSPSPRPSDLPVIVQLAGKCPHYQDSEASTGSATSEASDNVESIDSMSDHSSVRECTDAFNSSRPPSVRSKTPTLSASPPPSARSTSSRSTSSSVHSFRKVPSDESGSNNRSPSHPPSARSISPFSAQSTLMCPALFGGAGAKDSTPLVPSLPVSARCSSKIRPQLRIRRASEGNCRPAPMVQTEARIASSAPASPRRAQAETRSPFDSALGIVERIVQGKAISLERREACEAFRIFLFGTIGHEGIEAHHLSNYWKKKSFC